MDQDSDFLNYGKEWSLIESDPGVFYELVNLLGCSDVDFQEIFDIENGQLEKLEKKINVYGYIFLFKYNKDESKMLETSGDCHVVDYLPPNLIFPKQVVNNACATFAVLAVLLNQKNINLGTKLEDLQSICNDNPPYVQGIAIAQNEFILNAHNMFKAYSSFEFISMKNNDKQAAFHFISYIPFENKVYELDGLKDNLICLGEFENNWSALVEKRLKARINNLQSDDQNISEIRFNLMAVTENSLKNNQKLILEEKYYISIIAFALLSLGEKTEQIIEDLYASGNSDELDNFTSTELNPNNLPNDVTQLNELLAKHQEKLQNFQEREKYIIEEKERWKKENIYRRHDFVPFTLSAMRHLARKNELKKAYTKCS